MKTADKILKYLSIIAVLTFTFGLGGIYGEHLVKVVYRHHKQKDTTEGGYNLITTTEHVDENCNNVYSTNDTTEITLLKP